MKLPSPLVSAKWLYKHLEVENLVVLDATIPKVAKENSDASDIECIPKARFFDIKKKFSDTKGQFPNTLPTAVKFETEAQQLGIHSHSGIVVYDTYGLYSSARAWWLFKAFGFDNIAVLDGGLPNWKANNYKTVSEFHKPDTKGNFKIHSIEPLFTDFKGINHYTKQNDALIIDARSKLRFTGVIPEPRYGLRSGTITNSINLPYTELLNDDTFKSIEDITAIFNTLIKEQQTLVFTCGSGITACNLALGATLSGFKNCVVYDGSWTEYGTLTN